MKASVLSPAPGHITVIYFERDWIESMSISPALALLQPLIAGREEVERCAGTLVPLFHGYDDDPREVWDIPEVRRWFHALTEVFPYWLVFCDRVQPVLPMIFNLLLGPGEDARMDGGLMPARRHARGAISALLQGLFGHMNLLCYRLGIPLETNNRWTREISEVLNATTE